MSMRSSTGSPARRAPGACSLAAARPRGRVVLVGLICLATALGCRQQMAEQPRYDPMEESDFWPDGQSARRQENGTVPRGYLRTDALLYEGVLPAERWWQ